MKAGSNREQRQTPCHEHTLSVYLDVDHPKQSKPRVLDNNKAPSYMYLQQMGSPWQKTLVGTIIMPATAGRYSRTKRRMSVFAVSEEYPLCQPELDRCLRCLVAGGEGCLQPWFVWTFSSSFQCTVLTCGHKSEVWEWEEDDASSALCASACKIMLTCRSGNV